MKSPLPPSAGVSPDQGPPLSVVAPFFVMAPFAAAAAGLLLMARGGAPFTSPWTPDSIALTHLGTLGLLATCMVGALYQFAPTVAGAPVRPARLAHAVQVALPLGITALVGGLLSGIPPLVALGGGALALGATLFVVPTLLALVRSEVRTDTSFGLRLSVLAFAILASIGVWLALSRSGHGLPIPGGMPAWRSAHFLLGLLVWVGGLVSAVAWQVLPMFYTAPNADPRLTRALVLLQGASLLALPTAASAGRLDLVYLAAAPAGLAVGVGLPTWGIWALRRRKRKRRDFSVQAWLGGLSIAVLTAVVGLAAALTAWLPFQVLFAWLAIWGAAGLVMHGMLSRIVPFLVWFHRMSPLLGRAGVPPMRQLYAQATLKRSLVVHAASIAVGAIAILSGVDLLARITGLLVLTTAVMWGADIVGVLVHPAPEVPSNGPTPYSANTPPH